MSKYNSTQMTIAELIDTNISFEVPNYQRGYRWGKTEVYDLLNDIMDVVKPDVTNSKLREICRKQPYCLQPISFDNTKESEQIMIVVDGQQRLTTIFLVLMYITKRFENLSSEVIEELEIDDPAEFCKTIHLIYSDPTRNDVFSRVSAAIDVKNVENIDSYFITEAYSHIVEWGNNNIKKAQALNKFAIKFFYGTSIIWYEIDKNTDGTPNDYFAKTNTGRIPLTNSELIKANLMLDEYCIKIESEELDIPDDDVDKGKKKDDFRRLNMERLENQRIKMSRQWDTIENDLRRDEFWYFLTNNSDKYEDTRIDFIFDIVARELYPELSLNYSSIDEFFNLNKERASFIIIARYLTDKVNEKKNDSLSDPVAVGVWKKAWNTYMIFREWFDNREWYHYIGYLLSADSECTAENMLQVFKNSNNLTKQDIKDDVVELVKRNASIIYGDDSNAEERSLDEYKEYISKLSYSRNKEEINRILLLFNVISVLNDNKKTAKSSRDTYFPFSRYKQEDWNLEHIHSKEDNAFTVPFAREFEVYVNIMYERLKKDDGANGEDLKSMKAVVDEINSKKALYLREENTEDESLKLAAQDGCAEWIKQYRDDLDEERLNGIGNMAMLDGTTNKSYHNAPFFMKRMIINDIVMGNKENISRFIPFCTRNVFDKTYTKLPNAMLHWNNNDYEDYLNAIAEVIYNYFKEGIAYV